MYIFNETKRCYDIVRITCLKFATPHTCRRLHDTGAGGFTRAKALGHHRVHHRLRQAQGRRRRQAKEAADLRLISLGRRRSEWQTLIRALLSSRHRRLHGGRRREAPVGAVPGRLDSCDFGGVRHGGHPTASKARRFL